ncbi:hypothetical protein LMH87_004948 [Akanthomyces muscarius]|uniref:Uncharacterized protein n=1 Tax=Akanthomyces muscarius TaxID=2231603 RepID=A0A9W8QLI7_AKAMU|nr:hypothetical protein LMH87_004948 [Akanthomyces muscarius]KAJ4163205.1 hypothetical protein LMH87_004948 [Akanthomyces muscarius]
MAEQESAAWMYSTRCFIFYGIQAVGLAAQIPLSAQASSSYFKELFLLVIMQAACLGLVLLTTAWKIAGPRRTTPHITEYITATCLSVIVALWSTVGVYSVK